METSHVLYLIFECVKAFSRSAPNAMHLLHCEQLKEVFPYEYFLIEAITKENKRVIVNPKQVAFEILKAKANESYKIYATQAMLMYRVVKYFKSIKAEIGNFSVFLDPRRVIFIICALEPYKLQILASPPNPFPVAFTFPFGRSLRVDLVERKQNALDLRLKLINRDLFLEHEITDEINQNELGVFSKLKAHIEASKDGNFEVTLVTYTS